MLGIVVITYNSQKYLPRLLESLYHQSFTNWKLLLVDNGSEDILWPEYEKKVYVRPLHKNLGYAAAVNRGLAELAQDPRISEFLILNHDVYLDRDCLAHLLDTQRQTKADLVQPRLLLFDEKHINTYGNSLHYLGFSFCRDYQHPAYLLDRDQPIEVASGAAVLLSRRAALDLPLTENFFLYQEDTDLSWRAHQQCWEIYLSVDAVAFHDYAYRMRGKKYFFLERNRLLMLYQNWRPQTLWLLAPVFWYTEIGLLIYSLFKGFFHWKLAAYGSFLWRWPAARRLKKELQKHRSCSDRYVLEHMSATVQFGPIDNFFTRYFLNPVLQWWMNFLKKVVR